MLIVLSTSILLQLIAAGLALRLVRLSGFFSAWFLIATALLLMATRRSITLYKVVVEDAEQHFNYPAEFTALIISTLMVFGVLLIRPVILSFKDRENSLRASEAIYRGILKNMADTYYRTDREGRITMASASVLDLLDYTDDEVIGKNVSSLYADPKDRALLLKSLEEKGFVREFETILLDRHNKPIIVEASSHQIHDKDGQVIGVEGTAKNITDRKTAEQLSGRLGRIIESSVNEVYAFDSATLLFSLVNRGARENLGYSMKELVNLRPVDIKPKMDLDKFTELVQPLITGSLATLNFETVHQRKDGSTYPVEILLQYASSEDPPLFLAIAQDITERKKIEDQLYQAQKMETVGQLTGGLAHDFNNLLSVIQGNIELAQIEETEHNSEYLVNALGAVERGAALTHRLLAFSRKQVLEPEVVDLRTIISGMEDLLRRTLPENIELEIIGSANLWRCEVDPVQLENALLNLVINGRDAMSDGGKLTIETSNTFLDDQFVNKHFDTSPGQFVLMAVSDSGRGIPEKILPMVFDPFFTTKEKNRGTGLGLSMVYGFVKQSGGSIDIYSEENQGTTLKLYFPRTHFKISTNREETLKPEELTGNGEVILVVEDNEELGDVVVSMLHELGYQTLFAPNVAEAISIFESTTHVDLLLTDVILTGVEKGTDLATSVAARWPETSVLFMSGYTENAIIHNGRLDPGVELLAKPFTKVKLAKKVAQLLKS